MLSFISRLFARKTHAQKTIRSFRPSLESMEERTVLNCTFSLANAGHTLVITGDNHNNTVSIVQDDVNNKLTVIGDGVTHTYSSSQITKMVINLKGGNDSLSWKLADGSSYSNGK